MGPSPSSIRAEVERTFRIRKMGRKYVTHAQAMVDCFPPSQLSDAEKQRIFRLLEEQPSTAGFLLLHRFQPIHLAFFKGLALDPLRDPNRPHHYRGRAEDVPPDAPSAVAASSMTPEDPVHPALAACKANSIAARISSALHDTNGQQHERGRAEDIPPDAPPAVAPQAAAAPAAASAAAASSIAEDAQQPPVVASESISSSCAVSSAPVADEADEWTADEELIALLVKKTQSILTPLLFDCTMSSTPARPLQTASAASSAQKQQPRATPQRSPQQSRQQQQQQAEADLRAFDAIMSRQSNGAASIAARNAQLAARMQRPSYASASPDSSAVESSGSDSDDAEASAPGPRIISERLDDLMDDSSDRDVEDRMAQGHARMFPRDAAASGIPIFPSYDAQGRQIWPAIDPMRLVQPQKRQQARQHHRQQQSSPDDSDADDLNRSGELNPAELNALLNEASQLTGLSPAAGGASVASRNKDSSAPSSAAAGGGGDSPATLHAKLASERAALGDLLQKLGALQNQAAKLQEMSTLSNRSQEQMQSVLADTRNYAEASDSEGDDAGQSPLDSSDEEAAEQEQRFDSRSQQQRQQPYSTASPSDSDIEVEIERQPSSSSSRPAQPSDSEDEDLSADARQLAELEDWMAVLGKQSAELKAARQAAMTPAERERDEEEYETDQRLFFSQTANAANHSSHSNEGRARSRTGAGAQRHERFEDEADEEELRERARRQHATRSPITSASPSPPRVRERVRTAPSRGGSSINKQDQDYSPPRARSQKTAPRSPVAGIARVPVRAVPPVPISRWIGPSALPTAQPGGGSGSHVQYSDRPATAVGTARSAVARASSSSHQSSQTGSSPNGNTNAAQSVSWQAPTLSSLPPRPRQHKAASVSSKSSSLFVNAPSERGGQRRYGWATEGSEIAEDRDQDDDAASASFYDDGAEDEEAEEEYSEEEEEEEEEEEDEEGDSDSDWFVTVTQGGANAARAAASAAAVAAIGASPSDSDSELPYAINGPSAATAGRPKTARTAASSHLNGHASMAKSASVLAPAASAASTAMANAFSGRQQPPTQQQQRQLQQLQQQQQRAASSVNAFSGRQQPPPAAAAAAASQSQPRGSLVLSERQWVLARIGLQLFRHTLDHVGNTRARGTELGGGRLGASTTQREQAAAAVVHEEQTTAAARQQQRVQSARPSSTQAPRGYGFEPAIPTRAWPVVSSSSISRRPY